MLLKFCRSYGKFANQEIPDGLGRMNRTSLAVGYEVMERLAAEGWVASPLCWIDASARIHRKKEVGSASHKGIIRPLRWACNRATYPGSSAISTSLATALARRIWRGVRQRTFSTPGLATTTARQRARLVATFSRFRL